MEKVKFVSDKEIADSYKDFIIEEITITRTDNFLIDKDDIVVFYTGSIFIDFPNKENMCDHFLMWSDDRIAFEHWYPQSIIDDLTKRIFLVIKSINNEIR